MKNKKTLLFIIPIVIVAIALAVVLPLMSINKINTKSKEFINDGYMLVANKKSDNLENLNTQYFFSSGSKYQKTFDNQISFTDINGNKVTTDVNNFLHFNDGSLNGLSSSVLLNTDDVTSVDQISYYSISEDSILQKSGNNYIVSNAGNNITLSNFVWKESDQLYMAVSDEIKLIVGEGIEQTFDDYVELQYNDEGIAHLVTQDGTYSTISSDAYLLLSNGVRIYIGSKNVSNEEEVLMNLTQMVVDSDDNIEVIPDEDYTIENVEQPQIIVNATDGAEGEEGESGESGENGDNGENGAPGSQGVKGNKGTSDEKADVTYAPEKVPVFDNLKITPNAFGFDATMNYTSNDCDVAESHISVINNETGQETWVYTLKSADGAINMLAKNISISCTALDPSTQYTYVVYANWAPLVGDQHYNQSLAQQSFVTSSLGLDLTYYSATEDSINMKVTKNMDTVITQIKVELFDNFKDQMNPNVYARAISTTIEGVTVDDIYNDVAKIIDVSSMQIGDEIEVKFENLNPNTIYYAKMLIQKNSSTTAIPDVFEKIKVMTLKRTPFIEAPTGEYLTQMNAFKISTGSIRDYDGGITSYRYEIYPSGADYGVDTPAYSLTKSLPTEINVDVSNNATDPIHREKDYVARIIAIFNDNEKLVEVPSSFSSPFQSGQVAWPMASFDYTAEHITASTIEGTFIITDTNYAIQPDSIITIEATAATSTSTDYVLAAQAKVNLDTSTNTYSCSGIGGSTCIYNEAQKTYSIDIALQGLRKSTTYNFEVSATTIKTTTETGSHITSRAINTKSYDPIRLVEDIKERPNNAKFEIDVYFAALDPVSEAAKDATKYNSSLLDNLIDFSGKAISYIRVEVYEANQVYDFPARYNPGNLIGFTDFYDLDIDAIKEEGVVNKGNDYAHDIYDFSSSLYRQAYLDSKKYVQYLNNPDGHTLSECVVDGATPLKITDMSFSEDIRKELTAGNNYMLKINVVNDYCYGDGSNYFNYVQMSRSGDVVRRDEGITYKVQNEIQVGTNMGSEIYGGYNQANPQDDQWILFSISDQLPAVPQVNDSLDIVYQNTVLQNILNDSNAYNPDGYLNGHGEKELRLSNIYKSSLYLDAPGATSEGIYQSFLNGYGEGLDARKGFIEANIDSVLNDTAVGVAYSGPRELAEYITKTTPSATSGFSTYTSAPYADSSVLYTVYKVVEDDGGNKHEVKVTDSGWLTYLYHKDLNPKLPTYTFFFDLVDATTGLSIGRGEEFKIRTQVRLKLDDTAQIENDHNIIYPASIYTYYDKDGFAYYDIGGERVETTSILHDNQQFYNSTNIGEPTLSTPTYKQKVIVTPEEGEPYDWHINKNAYAEKCIPEILSVMYDGSKDGKDTVYLSVFDPDNYLTTNPDGKISLYYKDETAIEANGYSAYTYGTGDYYEDDPVNKTLPKGITHRVKLNLDDSEYLYYSYHVHRYDIANNIIDEERYINLLAQHGITNSMKVAFASDVNASNPVNFTIRGRIVSILEAPVSIVLENQTAYVAFVYQMMSGTSPMSYAEAQAFYRGTDGNSNNTPVVSSNLVFKNYEEDDTTVKNTLQLDKEIVNTNLIQQNGTHYFVAYSQVELPDIVDLIKTNASKIISCDVNLYFDNGDFGYHNQIGSGYYLLEYLNNGEGANQTNRGFGLNPNGNISGYPETVYVKNTSVANRENYYLFNKSSGTVKFDTKDKKMSVGSKSYYYDKYGIMYDSDKLAIAKGVSVVTKQGRTDQITNVFTVPYLDIDCGYSMFLINMTMSSNHTLITLDSTGIELPTGKTLADYPLTIEYSLNEADLALDDEGENPRRSKVELEIHADSTSWDDIDIKQYIDYTDPANPVTKDLENNTKIYYNVYGWYMNNGVPTKVHLINNSDGTTPSMKTITSYVHDFSTATLTHNWRAMEGIYKTGAREAKTVDYKFTITNRTGAQYTPSVIKEDFTNSMKYITFYLLKKGNTTNVDLNFKKVSDTGINLDTDVVTTQWDETTGDLDMQLTGIVAAKTVDINDVIATKTIGTETFGFIPNADSDKVGYVYFYNEFNFAPNENHVWDDNYSVIAEYVYKHGRDILGDESNPLSYKRFIGNSTIETMPNIYIGNRMTITADPTYNTDDQFTLDFTISGNEYYRVAGTYADHFAYIVELHDAVTNEVVNLPEYNADGELITNNYQRKYIETTFSANGYTYATRNFKFTHLEPNHQYYVNVYFVADNHNIGIENYHSYISQNLSDGQVLKALQKEADPEILRDLKSSPTVNIKLSECLVEGSEKLFTKKSDIFRTSLTSDTVVQAVYFNSITDDGAYFLTFGVNLNNIMRIEYDYRIGEDDLVTGQSVIFDPIHHTGDFVESSDGVYSLKLAQVHDPSLTYSTIVIRFYAGTTPGEGTLVSTIIKENIH